MITRTETLRMKRSLRRTWHTFFVRFGRLLPIQAAAIPVVLAGRNAFLVSPTASGKTEAVIAPLCERILAEGTGGLSVLYITPTRALANDLYDRLNEQIRQLHLRIDVKTGDRPALNWRHLPDIVITTPESFDSMLCRHPEALTSIEAVVLDEIHFLDGTYRGDQVRLLLRRLRCIRQDFSVYALSATVSNPAEAAARYAPDCEIIQAAGKRAFRESYVQTLDEVKEYAEREGINKFLIFCNSRKRTEAIAVEARRLWEPGRVVVHHGSLHKKERGEAEETMKSARRAVCVSTMTLELGIDIGDIDGVVLADPPYDTASFIQRIGRAGRRTGEIRIFAICDDNQEVFEALVTAARNNLLDEKMYREDLSVVVQQIFSILYANPSGVAPAALMDIFEGFASEQAQVERIIDHLREHDHIVQKVDRLYASESVMNLGERGKIHSNITDSIGVLVIDSARNREIGEIVLPTKIVREMRPFVLAGRVWSIERATRQRLYVRQIHASAAPAEFHQSTSVGAYFEYLPEDMQREGLCR
ncbi:MAG: DEAD/DEAH box helicase [Methanomicrobiales archaeon]|nr:DEAD/DEAH box helicase [Methanomicrobiales archaeon]